MMRILILMALFDPSCFHSPLSIGRHVNSARSRVSDASGETPRIIAIVSASSAINSESISFNFEDSDLSDMSFPSPATMNISVSSVHSSN